MQTTFRPDQKQQQISATRRRPPLLLRFLRGLLWSCSVALLCLAALESVFAIAHIGEEEFVKIDPLVGYRHLENKAITFRSEGYSQDKINSAGWRDSEHPLKKPANTLRIALLGDSRTEAIQVPLEKTFGKLIEKQLSARSSKNIEVLNFGMSAFSTGQEYLLYLDEVRKYKPDIVCVVYNCLDTDENVAPVNVETSTPRPYFRLDEERKLVIDWAPMQAWLIGERAQFFSASDWLRRNSRLYGLYSMLEPQLRTEKGLKPLFTTLDTGFKTVSGPLLKQLARPFNFGAPDLVSLDSLANEPVPASPYEPARIYAGDANARNLQLLVHTNDLNTKVTEAIVHRLNQVCRADSAKLVVVTMPAPNNSLFYFKEIRRLKEQAEREHFGYIDLHSVFPSLAPMEPSAYLYAKNHLSLKGHKLAADTMVEQLSRMEPFASVISK